MQQVQPPQSVEDARALLDRAQALLDAGTPNPARPLLRRFLPRMVRLGLTPPELWHYAEMLQTLRLPEQARMVTEALLEQQPGFVPAQLALAALTLEAGDRPDPDRLPPDTADLSTADRALRADLIGRIALRDKHPEQARAAFATAVALDPDALPYRIRLCATLLQHGTPEDAGEVIRPVADRALTHPGLAAIIVRIGIAMGEPDQAADLLDKARAVFPKAPDLARLDRTLAAERNDTDRLIQLLQDQVAAGDASPQDRITLAQSLFTQGQTDTASAVLDQLGTIFEDQPDSRTAVIGWAHQMHLQDRDAEASARVERWVQDAPEQGPLYVPLVRLLIWQDRMDEADSWLAQALERAPDDPLLLRFLMEEGMLPRTPETEAALEAAVPAVQAIQSLSQRLTQEAAHVELRDRLRHPPYDTPSDARSILLATATLNRGQTHLAERYLRACLRRWPRTPRLHSLLIRCLMEQDRLQEVLERLDHWPADTPGSELLMERYRVQILPQLGDLDGARTALNKARQLSPDTPIVADCLLRQYIAWGDYDRARAEREESGSITPETHPHWSISLNGQLYNELTIEHMSGQDLPTAPMGVDALAVLSKERPRSNIVATRFLAEWVQDPRRAPDPEHGRAIPQILFQYWDRTPPPPGIMDTMQSWQGNPGWTYRSYDMGGAIKLLREEFGPKWLQAFRMANNPAEASDLLRLCLLARDGGVWADADDRLQGSLDAVLDGRKGLVLGHERYGYAVGNNFIAAAPKHPVIVLAARQARTALLQRSNETTWSKTGPGLLARCLARFLAECVTRDQVHSIHLMPMPDLRRHISMHNPVSPKLGADSYWNRSGTGQTQNDFAATRAAIAARFGPDYPRHTA